MSASTANALAQEAERLLRMGRHDEAERACYALLAAVPDHLTALMLLGALYMAQGRFAEAEGALLRGCAVYPEVAGFHAALGRIWLQLNQPSKAVLPLQRCVLLEPENRDHRARLVATYQGLSFVTYEDESKQAMLACLADDLLSHSLMHKAWLGLVRVDPEGGPVLDLFDAALDFEAFRARMIAAPSLLQAIDGWQLFRRGLERFLAADVAIERGLTFLRRWLFERRSDLASPLPTLCWLARYCSLTEYVFNAEEDPAPLRADLSTPAAVALLGCYEPLWKHERAADLARLSDQGCYRDLTRALIDEPLEERSLIASIPSLSPIVDEVSRAVQGQYEEHPYPRWTTVGSGASAAAATHGQGRRILVAGCGTGSDAIDAALSFPGAAVDAIDLSRTSLAYGARKARDMRLGNVSFAQADLLEASRLGKLYDLVIAAGVLHHLRDPQAGWRALLEVLRPGGMLRILLYSRTARTAVADARAFIEGAGFPSTMSGIRAFRAAVIARAPDDPVRAWLTRSYDFYSLSQCRDLVFHVQEHTFTLPQIAGILEALELSLVRLDIPGARYVNAYHERFPDDAEATNLARWHEIEQLNPSMFAGMYGLWLCRTADRAALDARWLQADGAGSAPA